jgi:hypothetical protein
MNAIQMPKATFGGRKRLLLRRHGELIWDSGWTDNLLTNAGLNAMGQSVELLRYCMVGTGNATPAVTDTTLQAQIAVKDGATSSSSGVETAAPRFGWVRKTFVFPQGAVVGNLNEVGVGWTSTSVASRSLISPTKSVIAIDQLTVIYELRMYVPTGNFTGSVTIGARTYNYTIRAFNADDGDYGGAAFQSGWAPRVAVLGAGARVWNGYGATVYGAPAAVQSNVGLPLPIRMTDGGNSSPVDGGNTMGTASNAAYVDNSLSCSFTVSAGTGNSNIRGGLVWIQQTSGTAQSLNGLTAGGGLFVAVGASGVILTTPANETIIGQVWTSRTSGVATALNGVVYGGGLFVAVGAGGVILTSPDAITWTSRTSGTAANLNGVVYGGGLYVIVGAGGVILTSPDGTTWTSRTSGTANDLRAVTYGGAGGVYLAVGNTGTILSSGDATTWATRTSGTSANLVSAGFRNDIYLVGGDTNAVRVSVDGTSWAAYALGISVALNGFTGINGRIFASATPSGYAFQSVDGTSWTYVAHGYGSNAIASAADVIVSVGASGSIAAASGGGVMGFFYSGIFGSYQCVLDGVIPKDNTKNLSLTITQSWARRP